ncbi:transporter substrate-binding domain-containing protein [Actinomadura rayongensis]|uniref:Transporter substrate-binding domain-containing protein n=1 Tax=Actinomadura rayongensis TaxID=1429076 RepID=A0A6I4WFW6_9ACTN|nr:transporter substrate-binding domain-containing protein [Actinomadura rayongensis]MXQ67843.1 transporter substrate-binding domain-containing protein [Actinomadura rayongensis]
MPSTTRASAALAAAALCLTAAACGASGGSSGGSSAPAAADAGLRRLVPASFTAKGAVTVAVIQSPPFSVVEGGGKVSGITVDLLRTASARLGLTPRFVPVASSAVVAGLASGKFDLAGQRGDYVERQGAAATIDLVHSHAGGLVPASAVKAATSISYVCGRRVGLQQGSIANETIGLLNAVCAKAGKAAGRPSFFPDFNAMALALRSGRVDIVLNDRAGNQVAARASGGTIAAVDFPDADLPGFHDTLLGPGTSAANRPLAEAFLAAFRAMAADGTYAARFDAYGVAEAKLPADRIRINGSTQKLAG